MRFKETDLKGAFIIKLDLLEDDRGFFARSFCRKEFESHRLNPNISQCNVSFNKLRGTLRGMHYQSPPHEEAKLVRCVRGRMQDVIIDIRRDSPTFCKWIAVELSEKNHKMLYIPEGFAHGFQTLEDNTEVLYLMSESYAPECSMGIRYNDPMFNMEWPLAGPLISEKDATYGDFMP